MYLSGKKKEHELCGKSYTGYEPHGPLYGRDGNCDEDLSCVQKDEHWGNGYWVGTCTRRGTNDLS